ncbi:MAG: AlpA family phage regulatory protein [Arcobacteraceae bacterium]
MEDRLIKIATVMEYVQISKSKIYEYVGNGKSLFPQPRKIGGSSLWVMSEIQEYIKYHKERKNKVA